MLNPFNQGYNPLGAQVKLLPDPVCLQCGGPARIPDPFNAGDFFPCDCSMDRTPVLTILHPGPESWMERYFEEIG